MTAKPKDEAEDIVKTTLRVPRALLAKAKMRATMEGVSLQDLIVKAMQDYLKGGTR